MAGVGNGSEGDAGTTGWGVMSPDRVTGAVVAVSALLAGQWLPRPRLRRRPVKAAKSPQPVCGCTHHHSYHDPQDGECHGRVEVGFWAAEYHYKRCTCRQYSGPVPLAEVYAPEIAS